MDNSFIIRRGTVSDADRLSAIGRRTFPEDFSIPYHKKDVEDYLRSSVSRESVEKKLC